MRHRQVVAGLIFAALAAAGLTGSAGPAFAKVRVAASINDIASIASTVGGDEVDVFAIARPNSDVHHVEVLPSYMVKVSKAQVYLKVGLGLDQWADGIIDGSRNQKLVVVDCSEGVAVLEKPAGAVNASMGDVHPNGNPHYWLDPRNGAVVARTIADALAKADPAHGADFHARAEAFAKEAEGAWAREKAVTDKIAGKQIFTYHRSWTYLANAFGFTIAGEAEPVPGIPPTANHLAELVALAKARKISLFLQEPYFSDDAGKFLTREAGMKVVVMAPSCDATTAGSYLSHFHDLVASLAAAGTGQTP